MQEQGNACGDCPAASPALEFSRPIIAATVTGHPRIERLEATEAECIALAKRCRIEAVVALNATLRLRRQRREDIRVTGTLHAEVIQRCVVTLEPVRQHVTEHLSVLFVPESAASGPEGPCQAESWSVEDDDIESLPPGGVIDVGELVTQYLILGLDPFPRRSDADTGEAGFPADGDDGIAGDPGPVPAADREGCDEGCDGRAGGPFAVLSRLHRR